MSAAALLAQARTTFDTPGSHSNRSACWIARAALESAVEDLLAARDEPVPEASMRSKLTVLHALSENGDDLPARAAFAWDGLSRVCHHHAFELGPSPVEVRHLLDLVAATVESAGTSR